MDGEFATGSIYSIERVPTLLALEHDIWPSQYNICVNWGLAHRGGQKLVPQGAIDQTLLPGTFVTSINLDRNHHGERQ